MVSAITRRRWLCVSIGACIGPAVAGCTSEGTGDQNGGTPEEEDEETGNRETLYDTTVEDRLREEHEFSSGDILYVEASVNHDGMGRFALNVGPGEDLLKFDIDGSESFSQEIENDGTHIVNAIAGGGPDGRMDLLVKIERSEN